MEDNGVILGCLLNNQRISKTRRQKIATFLLANSEHIGTFSTKMIEESWEFQIVKWFTEVLPSTDKESIIASLSNGMTPGLLDTILGQQDRELGDFQHTLGFENEEFWDSMIEWCSPDDISVCEKILDRIYEGWDFDARSSDYVKVIDAMFGYWEDSGVSDPGGNAEMMERWADNSLFHSIGNEATKQLILGFSGRDHDYMGECIFYYSYNMFDEYDIEEINNSLGYHRDVFNEELDDYEEEDDVMDFVDYIDEAYDGGLSDFVNR